MLVVDAECNSTAIDVVPRPKYVFNRIVCVWLSAVVGELASVVRANAPVGMLMRPTSFPATYTTIPSPAVQVMMRTNLAFFGEPKPASNLK